MTRTDGRLLCRRSDPATTRNSQALHAVLSSMWLNLDQTQQRHMTSGQTSVREPTGSASRQQTGEGSPPPACGPRLQLAHGDAEATLELVLAVVEEGAEDQRERQRRQLLLQRCTNHPVTVQRTYNRGKPRASSSLFPRLPLTMKHLERSMSPAALLQAWSWLSSSRPRVSW